MSHEWCTISEPEAPIFYYNLIDDKKTNGLCSRELQTQMGEKEFDFYLVCDAR